MGELQLLDVGHFGAVEQCAAVVEPGADDSAIDHARSGCHGPTLV